MSEIQLSLKRDNTMAIHNSRNRFELNGSYFIKVLVQADQPFLPQHLTTPCLLLLSNVILFYLTIAIARRAFKYFDDADKIFEVAPPDYDDHWVLE